MAVSVRDFATRNPQADYDAITTRFGTPRQIAASCLEDMDTEELVQHLMIGRRIAAIVGAAALTVVLLWAGVVGYAFIRHSQMHNGYFGETVITVTDREEK